MVSLPDIQYLSNMVPPDMAPPDMAPARGATTMIRMRRLARPSHGSRPPIYRGAKACPCHGPSTYWAPSVIRRQSPGSAGLRLAGLLLYPATTMPNCVLHGSKSFWMNRRARFIAAIADLLAFSINRKDREPLHTSTQRMARVLAAYRAYNELSAMKMSTCRRIPTML